jgi:hypothetical protein
VRIHLPTRVTIVVVVGAALAGCGGSVIRSAYDQTYGRAGENWRFRREYPQVDRLFNGFDYGHAIVYERLLTVAHPGRRLDGDDFDFITGDLLRRPPANPLVEAAIGPHYATLIPEVLAVFDWAHMLHRQIYDVWSEPGITDEDRDARVARALRYYRSRPDLALSATPKAMDLMEGQPYSLAFRRAAPRFNRLLWSYHWLQMALYEALISGASADEQRHNVAGVVERFWELALGDSAGKPRIMPMSSAIAPQFSARYPEAAIIFDNLHSLHDVVADILASPVVRNARKRGAILIAAAGYRDDSTSTTSRADWNAMAQMMDIADMGGAALPAAVRRP